MSLCILQCLTSSQVAQSGQFFIAIFVGLLEQHQHFKIIIDSIIWAIKHHLPAIFELGLDTLDLILKVKRKRKI